MTLYALLSLFYTADHDRTPIAGLLALVALFSVLVLL